MDRRGFLKQSATAAGAAALATATAQRSRAAEPKQTPSPNEIIGVGLIGQGGMGSAHRHRLIKMSKDGEPVRVVAVCDVWDNRLNQAAQETGGKPYKDYRKLLEDKDVDAVLIATPDHWHAPITIAAANAGKHVYCEKPMTYWKDLNDARRVVEAIARNKRVMQVGTNGISDSIWQQAAERVRTGILGKIIHVQASDMRNGPIDVYDPTRKDPDLKPRVNLDWDMWLGPAPRRAFDPGRYLSFRVFWDYSGGITTDFFPHLLTPLISVLGLRFPKRVVSSGGLYNFADGREAPDIINVNIEYENGPSILLLGSVTTDVNLPMIIRGSAGTLEFKDPGAVIEPQRSAGKSFDRVEIKRERDGSLDEHWRDFLSCIKSGRKPRSNEELGFCVMAALHMAVHSYRQGRAMEFDPKKKTAHFV